MPQRGLMQAAEWWGTAKTSFLFHARGIEHHSNGVQNSLGTINLVLASGRIGKPKSGYGTIVGQANGQGGREHGQKCDQLPGCRDISNPEHRRYIAGVWGIDEPDIPGPGVDAYELFRKIDRGEIKGLLSICFNPKVSLPDNAFITRCLDKLEFYTAIDFFLNDTAWHADVVLPGSLQEEDEGTVTQVEGRIIKINKAVDCPGEAREDWRIIQDIAQALGRPHGFTFAEPREIFEELRVASKGGVADYSGVTYEKITQQLGVFWPCYSEDPRTGAALDDHPGTPRLFERGSYNPVARGSGPFYFPDGRARFNVAEYRPPVDDADEEYPVYLTTGRVVSQFLSGTQTRRIGPLVKQYAEPRIEMHPRLAAKLGIADGEWTTAETRRGTITLKAQVVTTIRPDTIFIPYHWAGRKSANQLTVAAQDPISKIPQYKVCGCRVRERRARPTTLRCSSRSNRRSGPSHGQTGLPALLHRSEPVHRVRGLHAGMLRVRHPSRRVDDPPRVPEPGRERADGARGLHALRPADVRRGLPGGCHQAHRRRGGAISPEATLHRLRELRRRLSVRRARALRRPQDHDEVRHVLRPDERRQEADVRYRVPEPGALLRHARADRAAAPPLGAGQHVPVRQADDHHAGLRHGPPPAGQPGAAPRCHRGDGGAADEPRGVAEGRERARRGDR